MAVSEPDSGVSGSPERGRHDDSFRTVLERIRARRRKLERVLGASESSLAEARAARETAEGARRTEVAEVVARRRAELDERLRGERRRRRRLVWRRRRLAVGLALLALVLIGSAGWVFREPLAAWLGRLDGPWRAR